MTMLGKAKGFLPLFNNLHWDINLTIQMIILTMYCGHIWNSNFNCKLLTTASRCESDICIPCPWHCTISAYQESQSSSPVHIFFCLLLVPTLLLYLQKPLTSTLVWCCLVICSWICSLQRSSLKPTMGTGINLEEQQVFSHFDDQTL